MVGSTDSISLEDIIEELELMVNSPELYLYNQSQHFYVTTTDKFKIGQGYYGRVEELTTILKISTHISIKAFHVRYGIGGLESRNKGSGDNDELLEPIGIEDEAIGLEDSAKWLRESITLNDHIYGGLDLSNIPEQQELITSNSNSGYKGVKKNKKRWEARVTIGKTLKTLGTFDTPEQAAQIYARAVCYLKQNEQEKAVKSEKGGDGTAVSQSDVNMNVDVVFVSGSAGSGKSKFVKFVGDYLENTGWLVLRIKFSLQRESQEILSSLFDTLIINLISMKNGSNESDRIYSERATSAIRNALDHSSMPAFVPSLQLLIPDINTSTTRSTEANIMSHWQLVYLLSAFIGSIVRLDRNVMFCLDDLQWCDGATLSLLCEVLVGIQAPLLCVGIYRDDEITETHPFTKQLDKIQKSDTVDLTEIKLPSLTRDDVADMIMSELRLPRRLVYELADIVHKKTSGHALFVIQFLSALLHDSAIAYSPMKHRFDWDVNKISTLQIGDDVASLIVSNLSQLEETVLRSLRILSCFGISSELCIFKMLDSSSEWGSQQTEQMVEEEKKLDEVHQHSINEEIILGTSKSRLADLVGRGVIEMSNTQITFTHDLIQQSVYENIPLDDRRQLHHDISHYLASLTSLDLAVQKSFVMNEGLDNLYLSDDSSLREYGIKPSTLMRLAVDQINAAGPSFIAEETSRTKYAGWNLVAGKNAKDHSNFQTALFNYKIGIEFISDSLWSKDSTHELCRELHEGAAYCLYALGSFDEVKLYTNATIDNVSFEAGLFAQDLLLRSLRGSGELGYSDAIARGIDVLRQLKIDLPAIATPTCVFKTIRETRQITSQYTSESILKQTSSSVNARKRSIFNIFNIITGACYRQSSPNLPLIACAMVQYSLSNGVVKESATAFVVFGFFLIHLEDNFQEAQRMADIAQQILDPQVRSLRVRQELCISILMVYSSILSLLTTINLPPYPLNSIHSRRVSLKLDMLSVSFSSTSNIFFDTAILNGFLLFWFKPHREIASALDQAYHCGMKIGDVSSAAYTRTLSIQFSFFGGEHLGIISDKHTTSLQTMVISISF